MNATNTTKPLIDIVTHAYALELQHYADFLVYQLSSLAFFRQEKCRVRITVCCNEQDYSVIAAVNHFWNETQLDVWLLNLTLEELGRRSIGRNRIAKNTEADLVWFADVDHLWRHDCLDKLATMQWPANASMVFPTCIKIQKTHLLGDLSAVMARQSIRIMDVNENEFIDKTYNRAIGGVQIVQGDFAREYGYLDKDLNWQTPRVDGKPFGDFRDDVAYRRFCSQFGEIVGVDLPGVYRLRHTHTSYQPPKV